MEKSRLTTRKIKALKPREKRYSVSDGHGLTLKVQPSGTMCWVLRVSTGGRVTDLALGHWPDVSLLQARQLARKKRKDLGQEPPRGYVLRDAFKLWCGLKRGRIVSYRDERRRLERYIIGPLGGRQIDEISAPLVIQTVKAIEASGHQATLKRVITRTREILDLAVCAGYIEHNPISRLTRVFAPPVVRPMPSVPWQELKTVMRVMTSAPEKMKLLFLWQLSTLLRPAEAVKIRKEWIEVDLIEIPGSEMKKARRHRVPLTPLMRRAIDAAAVLFPHPRSGFLLPGRSAGTHVSAQALAKHLHGTTLRGKLVAHGLRSLGRSWLADHGAPYEAAEACLAHVAGSQVSRAYQRSDYLDQRRELMAAWCGFIEDCAREVEFMPGIAFGLKDSED